MPGPDALALLLIGAGLGLRQAQNVDEERFLGVALEMLDNGSWLIPHRAGEILRRQTADFHVDGGVRLADRQTQFLALYIPGAVFWR